MDLIKSKQFELEILYRDPRIVIVNKPSGWDVHRNEFNRHRPIVLQALRNQINQEVHPVHRLDGGTSGVLMFTTDKVMLRDLSADFAAGKITKTYRCFSRGFAKDVHCLEPLRVHEKTVEASTQFSCLASITLPWVNDRYPESRYSLIKAIPETGRYHQIRRHLRFLAWPIVGDSKHGDGTHNQLWREHMGIDRLMLHAETLSFNHPEKGPTTVSAGMPDEFVRAMALPGWEYCSN